MNRWSSAWDNWSSRKQFFVYTLGYTLLFTLLCRIVFNAFIDAGAMFIWHVDGISQNIQRTFYISDIFREGIRALLAGEGWTVPMYDFRQALVAFDLQIGFPFILAALFPREQIGNFYQVMVLANYYLTGLSFSALGFYFKRRPLPVLAGAVTYMFCGFALFAGVRHPHFMPPMVLLPLMLIGAEKILKKETAWILTISVFL